MQGEGIEPQSIGRRNYQSIGEVSMESPLNLHPENLN